MKKTFTYFKREVIWCALLVAMAGGWSIATSTAVEARSADCYYDEYFNWCFRDLLPHNCLCDI